MDVNAGRMSQFFYYSLDAATEGIVRLWATCRRGSPRRLLICNRLTLLFLCYVPDIAIYLVLLVVAGLYDVVVESGMILEVYAVVIVLVIESEGALILRIYAPIYLAEVKVFEAFV